MSSLVSFLHIKRNLPQTLHEFVTDLDYVYKTLITHHPGIHNPLDPNFITSLKKAYMIAKETLDLAPSPQEQAEVLENFGRSFQDKHLWIYYDLPALNQTFKKPLRHFSLEPLNDHLYWMTLPTFDPSETDQEALKAIITQLPSLRTEKIVFDLRGNTGGNSEWGVSILKAFFGEDYALQHIYQATQNTYVEWRATQENAEHVKGFSLPTEAIYEGICQAIELNNLYYTEHLPTLPQKTALSENCIDQPIIAIIDRSCGSAALDFLDGLKAMDANLFMIGETTSVDSLYMELRTVPLPSQKGAMGFPIKVYRNRLRGHNTPHIPNIPYVDNLQETQKLQEFVKDFLSATPT